MNWSPKIEVPFLSTIGNLIETGFKNFPLQMPELVGVGLTIKITDDGECTVLNTIPGGSAHECGRIAPGDILIGVLDRDKSPDFVMTRGLEFNDIKNLIIGTKGSKISLRLEHCEGKTKTGTFYECEDLTREPISFSELTSPTYQSSVDFVQVFLNSILS
jgi:C-terminal processing protease CtpA/Prc